MFGPMMPPDFEIELFYTLTVTILCFLVFLRTKDVYELTKHKGVQFFRLAFMFFGLAYTSRLFLYGFMIKDFILFEPFTKPLSFSLMPVFSLILAYFSSMAILYLIYSTIWRRYSSEHFLTIANVVALLISVVGFVSSSPLIVTYVQLVLFVVLLIMTFLNNKQETHKKKTHLYKLYFLIPIFWLISLFIISGQRLHLPTGAKITLEVISLVIFIYIYYKIAKWVK